MWPRNYCRDRLNPRDAWATYDNLVRADDGTTCHTKPRACQTHTSICSLELLHEQQSNVRNRRTGYSPKTLCAPVLAIPPFLRFPPLHHCGTATVTMERQRKRTWQLRML
jgi:hypothetical protein